MVQHVRFALEVALVGGVLTALLFLTRALARAF
jgi:hypothetical protein